MKTVRQTPMQIADKLIEQSYLTDNLSVLEPSAGEGLIIDRIFQNYTFTGLDIDCVELNKEKAQTLSNKGYNTYHIDFLQFKTEKKYDKIIAAPPFKGNADIFHIQHMFELLKPKGIIISLTSPYWLTNNEKHQVDFRKWLESKEYYLNMVPDNSFVEKYKSVPTSIIKIFKK